MKQVLQDARSGVIQVAEVPVPRLLPGCVLVRIAASLVSAGTERASSEFASKNLVQKAQARPDLVREVLNKVRRDGVLSTLQAVRTRLDQPTALGYSSAGTVLAVGDGVTDLLAGDRVACAGAGYAVHAEVACVPRLLCAKLPAPQVSFEEAAFTTVGAVALHGIRVAEVKLGEVVGVIGLGLLGQLTAQMLRAAGCRILGMDIAPTRAQLAVQSGATAATSSPSEFLEMCLEHTHGCGVDAVLITAETASSDPVNLAGQVARDRAVVTAVGTVGMDIERKTYYEKELDFRISRSYGPGRYDAVYEQKGRDYPIGYVRWTETRNMEGFLQLLCDGKLDVKSLITHRVPIAEADRAYQIITGRLHEPSLGVIFTYPEASEVSARIDLRPAAPSAKARASQDRVAVGLLGAGGFAVGTLLPAMKQVSGVEFVACCAATGVHSRSAGDKFGFRYCTTDENQVLRDPSVNTVVVATRHHLHARQVLAALAAGKHVFCEKPLCLTEEELGQIAEASGSPTAPHPQLMVGFNRRFAPMAIRMKEFLDLHEPLVMHYRVNAGFIPADHWVQDPEQGGGRIRGEVCHFVDLLTFLAGSLPVWVEAQPLANSGRYSDDNVAVTLRFENGSLGTIHYLANGDKAFSKERVEAFGGGAAAILEDFRRLELVRSGRSQVVRTRLKQDKGHAGEWEAFARSIRSGTPAPIPISELVAVSLATLRIALSRSTGEPQAVNVREFLTSANASSRLS
jgi:predicted dehydrogenase/threonine dehydrogenase-like Zn-dependent dehydrogenase